MLQFCGETLNKVTFIHTEIGGDPDESTVPTDRGRPQDVRQKEEEENKDAGGNHQEQANSHRRYHRCITSIRTLFTPRVCCPKI